MDLNVNYQFEKQKFRRLKLDSIQLIERIKKLKCILKVISSLVLISSLVPLFKHYARVCRQNHLDVRRCSRKWSDSENEAEPNQIENRIQI